MEVGCRRLAWDLKMVLVQALSLMRRMRSDLRRELHRLSERQTKASRVLAQNGLLAATAALEAVCTQLDFVRSLRELYSAELAAHVASYNLVGACQPSAALQKPLVCCSALDCMHKGVCQQLRRTE